LLLRLHERRPAISVVLSGTDIAALSCWSTCVCPRAAAILSWRAAGMRCCCSTEGNCRPVICDAAPRNDVATLSDWTGRPRAAVFILSCQFVWSFFHKENVLFRNERDKAASWLACSTRISGIAIFTLLCDDERASLALLPSKMELFLFLHQERSFCVSELMRPKQPTGSFPA